MGRDGDASLSRSAPPPAPIVPVSFPGEGATTCTAFSHFEVAEERIDDIKSWPNLGERHPVRAVLGRPDPRLSVLEQIAASGLVPVVRIERAGDAPELARTLAGAGLPCIEVTFRSDAAEAAIRAVRHEVPDALVGAGTIVSRAQLERALAAGAMFIVSPGLQVDVVQACLERDIPVLPGVLTPTELIRAMDLGLSAVKLFPAASAGGPAYLRALAGPFPTVRFVPTGGIDQEDLESYLRVPSVLAVGGSWMVRPDLLAARDWASVGQLAATASAIVRAVRGAVPG